MENLNYIVANWQAPAPINAITTIRAPGASLIPFEENNLALHVGDNSDHVKMNRDHLIQQCNLIKEPVWLNQTHSNRCITAEIDTSREADAVITREANLPLAILTADCLPILLCNKEGTEIAAIHAGWRGLGNRIIENTIDKMWSDPATLLAWIGPAICQKCFQVGEEVFYFYQKSAYHFSSQNFIKTGEHWYANLPQIATEILQHLGVQQTYQSYQCTFEQENFFYSYRRNSQTGRIATLIWINSQPSENHD